MSFESAYNQDAAAFYQAEMDRSESTLKEYTVVFKVIPILIILAALVLLFIHTPTWRAIGITTIAMLTVILLVDGTAHARIDAYHQELEMLEADNESI